MTGGNGVWWALLLRGILAVLFGIIAFSNPAGTALAIYVWFALFAVVDGIVNVFVSFEGRGTGLWSGVISIIAGILAFAFPTATVLFVLYLIAARAVIDGVAEAAHGGWRILGGVLSILFGLWMFGHPAIGGLAILWVVGIYAVVVGVVLIGAAFRLRSPLQGF
jgi:uncharacterized membrane protein HdeD (DUF308 family)